MTSSLTESAEYSRRTQGSSGVSAAADELLDVEMDGAVGALEEMMEEFESKSAGC